MATINLRQLDDDVVQRLKHRASVNSRSLEGEVRHILKSAVKDEQSAKRETFLALSEQLLRATEGRLHTPAEVLIHEDRDHGYRNF